MNYNLKETEKQEEIINIINDNQDNTKLILDITLNPLFITFYNDFLKEILEKKTNSFFKWKKDSYRKRTLYYIIENGKGFPKKDIIRFLKSYNEDGSFLRNKEMKPEYLLKLLNKNLTSSTIKWLISVFVNYENIPEEFINHYYEKLKSVEIDFYWQNEEMLKLLYSFIAKNKNTIEPILRALSEMSSVEILQALSTNKNLGLDEKIKLVNDYPDEILGTLEPTSNTYLILKNVLQLN